MAHDSGRATARFARSLFVRDAAPELVLTEAAGFGAAEAPPGVAAEAVGPRIEELVPRKLPKGVSRDEVTDVAGKVLRSDELSDREIYIAEAIIIPEQRPAVFVTNDDYAVDHPAWTDYVAGTPAHANFVKAIPSVGRIELKGHPSLPYGGTGFLVGPDLLMTNRHVAQIFATGLGTSGLRFLDGLGAGIDFRREHGNRRRGTIFAVRKLVMIHPYWDLALLKVEGLDGREPLTFAPIEPDPAKPRRIAVIGYPAFDPRNDAQVQDDVFHGVYNVKRLQPGLLNGRRKINSFGKLVDAATHDSSTLGGNSGSVVVDASSGRVLGLHFAGIYKDSNFAVPASDLARDSRLVDAGLQFEPKLPSRPGPWDPFWAATSSEGATDSGDLAQTVVSPDIRPGPAGGTASITVPIQLDLTIGIAGVSLAGSTTAGQPELTEKMVEPIHDPVETHRDGYDRGFIGIDVPLPVPRDAANCVLLEDGSSELKYHHFSVVMDRSRRLAMFTAANVDAAKSAKEPEPGQRYTRAGLTGLAEGDVEKWYTDPRIRGTEQLPDRFFNKDRKSFDKGHLVRREDVAWGKSFAEVRAANGDTYFVTNCSPQVAGFNRSNRRDNWGALEDLVLKQAQAERYCLFSGPVLKADDPPFAGVDDVGAISVRIPRKYWKVVVANSGQALKVFAFILEQDLASTPMEFSVPASWRRHMIRLSDLESELGSLDFDPRLHAADQFAATTQGGDVDAPLVRVAAAQIAAMEPADMEAPAEAVAGHGRFVGLPAKVTFDNLDEDRRSAHLLEPIMYADPGNAEWPVPKGAWLDGASIPRAFWTVIGSPFTGRYLEASIVHDYYCDHPRRPWRDTHRMFHEAMLCRGVSSFKARVMFYAVYRFGPRWPEPGSTDEMPALVAPAEPLNDAQAKSILADAQVLAANALTVAEIERLADRHMKAKRPASRPRPAKKAKAKKPGARR